MFPGCGARSGFPDLISEIPLSVPGNFRGELLDINTVLLSWDSVPGASSYKVEFRNSAGPFQIIPGGGEVKDTAIRHEHLSSFANYYYRVSSLNSKEESEPTEVLNIHTHLPWERLEFGEDSTLDIGTFNIQHFPRSGSTTVEQAAIVLKNLELDIIVLQEIEDIQSFDEMLEQSGYNGYLSNSAAFDVNLAVAYDEQSVELLKVEEVFLEDILLFPRPLLVMKFSWKESRPFWIVNLHLKCCGDGLIDESQYDDEEYRRIRAINQLTSWVEMYHPYDPVIVLGDWNDDITEPDYKNVFLPLFNAEEGWFFADMEIATDNNALWSYPSYPSHLDHICLSDEFESVFTAPETLVEVIPLHYYYYNGFNDFASTLSDHLPLTISLPEVP
ncbi:MAG: endonuclease/exonuclease/phosphatase family protein [Deltaproteobacteria bacterium]|nr:endonuclease/exonuclease/phosphatase family protein [Deltaproteobacteria bacterium]